MMSSGDKYIIAFAGDLLDSLLRNKFHCHGNRCLFNDFDSRKHVACNISVCMNLVLSFVYCNVLLFIHTQYLPCVQLL